MSSQNSKDQLFHQLLCDLAHDIVTDTQSAAEETMDLSDRFLSDDKQNLVEDFRAICANDDSLTPEQLVVAQQNMEMVVNKNEAIRAEVNVVLGAMQFSEFLRQHLDGIKLSFDIMINAVEQSEAQIKSDMQKKMHTFDERKAFHECVMHEPMPVADQEVNQDLIDALIG